MNNEKLTFIILATVFGVSIILNLLGYLEEEHTIEQVYRYTPTYPVPIAVSGTTISNTPYGILVNFDGGGEN